MYADLSLPIVTISHAGPARRIGSFGLVTPPFTNPYQPPDLGQGLPCVTFTNLYHRDGGPDIELSIYDRATGIGHQVAGWARVM
jgi:hypothetical protein